MLRCVNKQLDLTVPQIMGVINVTPDSYFSNSRKLSLDAALNEAENMISEGATILDIGGESTRPGAQTISVQNELDRVMPIIEGILQRFNIIVSVDTYKPAVMQAAINAGVHIINDIYGLRQEGVIDVIAKSQVAVCVMHMQGEPTTMQNNPSYNNVVSEVIQFLQKQVESCIAHGISRERIIIDPGFGFGKSAEHNLLLLNQLKLFKKIQLPILVGLSRKSMLGKLLGLEVTDRLPASLALATLAVMQGANIIRTHDVQETAQAVQMAHLALLNAAESVIEFEPE